MPSPHGIATCLPAEGVPAESSDVIFPRRHPPDHSLLYTPAVRVYREKASHHKEVHHGQTQIRRRRSNPANPGRNRRPRRRNPTGNSSPELPDERQTARFPDPRPQKQISLGLDKDSPRLRLLRSHRFNQMQIRSDEELPEAARDTLTAAGWTERPEEGIWTRQLPPRAKEGEEQKAPWPTVLEAERLFHDLANGIRADRGLPPDAPERGSAQQR